MRKRNIKIFNPDKEYSIMEISQKTGIARRTITENWKKYGLQIGNYCHSEALAEESFI